MEAGRNPQLNPEAEIAVTASSVHSKTFPDFSTSTFFQHISVILVQTSMFFGRKPLP